MWRSADADVRDAEMERHEIENDITAEFSRLADDAKRLSEETGKEVKPQTFAKGRCRSHMQADHRMAEVARRASGSFGRGDAPSRF